MSAILNRREFAQAAAGLGLWATLLKGAADRNIRIGHTGITWPNNQIDQAIRDIAGLGFHGLETFGNVLESLEARGGVGPILEQNKLALISAYCGANLTDAARRNDEREKMLCLGQAHQEVRRQDFRYRPQQCQPEQFRFQRKQVEHRRRAE